MNSMTTDLAPLLRACIVWRDDRPWADNDALLVVADWLEEAGRATEAHAIRDAMEWDAQSEHAYDGGPDDAASPRCLEYSLMVDTTPDGSRITMDLRGGVYLALDMRDDFSGHGQVNWQGESSCHTLAEGEECPSRLTYRSLRLHPGPLRVRDVCRCELIFRMLGYPPLRLMGDG